MNYQMRSAKRVYPPKPISDQPLTTNNQRLTTIVNMQNKPNFQEAKMNLTSYGHKYYEHKPRLRTAKKQTQSNPISAQMRSSDGFYIHKMHLPPTDTAK